MRSGAPLERSFLERSLPCVWLALTLVWTATLLLATPETLMALLELL